MNYKPILEGILFLSGDEGLSIEEICDILDADKETVNLVIRDLSCDCESSDRGLNLVLLGNKYKFVTKLEYCDYYKKLVDTTTNTLSQAALETLAVIAYNEPITRVEIDEIRGVSSSHLIRKLVLKGLIVETGKSSLPGRPNLYKTTDKFLDYFNLSSKEELPVIEKPIEEDVETSLFDTKYKEQLEEFEEIKN